jgi:hypothetical protein
MPYRLAAEAAIHLPHSSLRERRGGKDKARRERSCYYYDKNERKILAKRAEILYNII